MPNNASQPPRGGEAAPEARPGGPAVAARDLAALLPLAVGLACSRAGLISSAYSSYSQTDAGIYSDGTTLVASAVLALLLVGLARLKEPLSKRTVNRIARACIVVQAASVVALGALPYPGGALSHLLAAVSIANAVASPCAMFYWLRRARGSSSAVAAALVFSSMALSEVLIFLCDVTPDAVQFAPAAVLTLAQLPAMQWAQRATKPYQMPRSAETDPHAFLERSIKDKRVLISSALGVAALGLTIGLLRGYPEGQAIAFDPVPRIAYMLLAIALCAGAVALCLRGAQRHLTSSIWVALFALACCALTAYAFFPGNLQAGAVFTTALNAFMVAYCYYLTIQFMTYGWRDPYYYALAGWLMFFLPRSFARIVLAGADPLVANHGAVLAVMADAIVASALLVFMRFLRIANSPDPALAAPSPSPLRKVMSLSSDDEVAALESMRRNAIAQGIADMGERFALSAREREVIALYAQGHTQKKIAEELFISPGTVHEHIRHVYTKTGLHSRQDILDYVGGKTS